MVIWNYPEKFLLWQKLKMPSSVPTTHLPIFHCHHINSSMKNEMSVDGCSHSPKKVCWIWATPAWTPQLAPLTHGACLLPRSRLHLKTHGEPPCLPPSKCPTLGAPRPALLLFLQPHLQLALPPPLLQLPLQPRPLQQLQMHGECLWQRLWAPHLDPCLVSDCWLWPHGSMPAIAISFRM